MANYKTYIKEHYLDKHIHSVIDIINTEISSFTVGFNNI